MLEKLIRFFTGNKEEIKELKGQVHKYRNLYENLCDDRNQECLETEARLRNLIQELDQVLKKK